MGASPGAALRLTQMNSEIDVCRVLPTIRVPALILHRTADRCLLVEEGRYVAGLIPGARFVEFPGEDHLPFVGDQDAMLDEIEAFLTDSGHRLELDRVLATVMCARVSLLPDDPGRGATVSERLDRFYVHARQELEWFRGRCFEAQSGGFTSTFDGPARAIRCACAISAAAPRLASTSEWACTRVNATCGTTRSAASRSTCANKWRPMPVRATFWSHGP